MDLTWLAIFGPKILLLGAVWYWHRRWVRANERERREASDA